MGEVERHYDNLLAEHYSWMSGMSFAEKSAEQLKLLKKLGFSSGDRGQAVDLGCGPGYQSMALSEIGYQRVIAFDTSQTLLKELAVFCLGRSIEPILADLRDFSSFIDEGKADAIVCMGDTITHLESRDDVINLLRDAHRTLRPNGKLALTYRDFSAELTGTDRFIPVHSDEQRIMMCGLYYETDYVDVNDLIYIRSENGWQLYKSSYRKTRLSPDYVAEKLREIGFTIVIDEPINRMQTVVARKA